MQHINQNNAIGLETELTTLQKSFAALRSEWRRDKDLRGIPFDHVRINPLQAEQHATTIRGVTVVQSSDVPMGKVQLITITPF
jgi:hypothetical protein